MDNFALDLALTETAPQKDVTVCLNMIVGERREPYLAASMESTSKFCDWAVININGDEKSGGLQRNLEDILASSYNKEDRLTILGLPFRNFAFNRNICLEASRNAKWLFTAGADEVWYDTIGSYTLEELLERANCMQATRIVGTFWHFLRGHELVHNSSATDLLYSTECFLLRMRPDLWWHDTVHEQPSFPKDRDMVLTAEPAFAHFSYIDPVRVFDKWVQYETVSGRPDQYAGYFNDPDAPWRKGPINVLDDRTGHSLVSLGGRLPSTLNNWVLDDRYHLHTSVCLDHHGSECCNHDPMVCEPKEDLQAKIISQALDDHA